MAEACRRRGLSCVQLTPNFPGLPFHEPGQITPDRCRTVAEPLHAAGIRVACLTGSTNLMDPDLDRRHRGILRLRELIRHCREFGTHLVVAETGSPNPPGACLPEDTAQARAAWAELRLILTEALALAAEHGVTLLLKPEPAQMLASLEDAVRLRDDLDHPNLGFVLDPVNFLFDAPPEQFNDRLAAVVEQLGRWSPVVHVKDIRLEGGDRSTPRVGQGVVDYRQFLRLLARHQAEAPLILEHLRPDEVAEARDHLQGLLHGATG